MKKPAFLALALASALAACDSSPVTPELKEVFRGVMMTHQHGIIWRGCDGKGFAYVAGDMGPALNQFDPRYRWESSIYVEAEGHTEWRKDPLWRGMWWEQPEVEYLVIDRIVYLGTPSQPYFDARCEN